MERLTTSVCEKIKARERKKKDGWSNYFLKFAHVSTFLSEDEINNDSLPGTNKSNKYKDTYIKNCREKKNERKLFPIFF